LIAVTQERIVATNTITTWDTALVISWMSRLYVQRATTRERLRDVPTKIQWTINADGSQGETWNPVSGCRRKSPGCLNCYAERSAHRLSGNPNEKIANLYGGVTQITNGRPGWSGKTGFSESALLKPLRTRKPTTYFISLSDLFYDGRPTSHIDMVFAVMALCPQHRFQVLSKYPERMFEYVPDKDVADRIGTELCLMALYGVPIPDGPSRIKWPLPNVWLGVSCEDRQRFVERTVLLRRTPAAVRFLSLEPLLEDLGDIDLADIDWVIAGAESGPSARPAQTEWFRSIKDQCVAAGVPFFLKQFADAKGHKIGTPELDGQQWMQMPEVPCR
jgi:protein gp37